MYSDRIQWRTTITQTTSEMCILTNIVLVPGGCDKFKVETLLRPRAFNLFGRSTVTTTCYKYAVWINYKWTIIVSHRLILWFVTMTLTINLIWNYDKASYTQNCNSEYTREGHSGEHIALSKSGFGYWNFQLLFVCL